MWHAIAVRQSTSRRRYNRPLMSILQSIVLGLVQGITEFLPISSSAHLIVVPYVLGWPDAGLRFAIVTNAGSLAAVMFYFRRTLAAAILDPAEPMVGRWHRPGMVRGAIIGTIPVALFGLTMSAFLAGAARSTALVAATTVGFGLLLGLADRVGRRQRSVEALSWRDVAMIGLAQAFALIPGTSRSGVTMTAALALGLRRQAAARFSMMLAIPVGILALAKDVLDLVTGSDSVPATEVLPLLVGFLVSGLSAYFVIGALLRFVERSSFTVFVIYRVVLGALLVALLILR